MAKRDDKGFLPASTPIVAAFEAARAANSARAAAEHFERVIEEFDLKVASQEASGELPWSLQYPRRSLLRKALEFLKPLQGPKQFLRAVCRLQTWLKGLCK